MSKLTIGLAQLNSNDDIARNLDQIIQLIKSLSKAVDIVFFPENALFFRIKENESVQYFGPDSSELTVLAQLSCEKNLHIHLGSVPFMERKVPYNASVLITPSKKIIKSYSKIHLFDIQLNHEKAIKESDFFQRGEEPAIFILKGWRFGQSICYDVRFSELYRHYNSINADVLLVPAAFLKKTGTVHWHILNRARAIENQAYVLASAQMGPHYSMQGSSIPPKETFGHSLCVSPWGEIQCELTDAPSIKILELDKKSIETVKKQIPMDSHRYRKSGDWTAREISLD